MNTNVAPTAPTVTPAGEQATVAAVPVAPIAPAVPIAPAAPVEQPQVAPVAPVAPAAPAQETPAAPEAAEVYKPTFEDPAVRSVENMFVEKGISAADVEKVFADAFKHGDVEKADMKRLTELLGENNAALAMNSLRAYQTQNNARVQRVVEYGHQQFGGEQEMQKAVAWVKANLSHPSIGPELAVIRETLMSPGVSEVAAKLAIDNMLSRYKNHANTVQGRENMHTPDGGNGGVNMQPFASRREYAEAMQEARKSRDPQKVAQVNARFAVSTSLHAV